MGGNTTAPAPVGLDRQFKDVEARERCKDTSGSQANDEDDVQILGSRTRKRPAATTAASGTITNRISAGDGQVNDLLSSESPKKRKRAKTKAEALEGDGYNMVDLTGISDPCPKKPRKQQSTKKPAEKRLRRYRAYPPQSFYEIKDRALSQRMFVLDRQRPSSYEEHITMAGTTGNIYTITISKEPSCTCPHAQKGNQCKHIVYVLSRVLKVPSELSYQLAFLSSELVEIFDRAGPLPSSDEGGGAKDRNGNRKPFDKTDDCGICCCEFGEEQTVYCKASCGNSVHEACFERWATSKRGEKVTCPFW